MIHDLCGLMSEHRQAMYLLLQRYAKLGKPFLVWPDIVREYEAFRASDAGRDLDDRRLEHLIQLSQEGAVSDQVLCLAARLKVVTWQYLEVNIEEMACREISAAEYMQFKERIVEGGTGDRWVLEIDLSPFERGFPKLTETRSIGRGVEFLNRYLSGRMFNGGREGLERVLHFLKVHQAGGQQLMLNSVASDVPALRQALRSALEFLQPLPSETPWSEVQAELCRLGFEAGWGQNVERVRETMELLSDILEAPSPDNLARFLSRIPMIFTIAILSPHGFFSQSGVLGKPDTGGQIVYILDQVRALEKEMRSSIQHQGLQIEPQILVVTRLIPDAEGTSCDQRIERITGTHNARILRVPFRDPKNGVVRPWISRFNIWPYLERFAVDVERELINELGGRPDFLVGNYSDGNLVASILGHRLEVTQCNIAHALEKTKYLHSDLHWRDYEPEYHFSAQHTADLISMNTADFIITSTYQEIAGTKDAAGQYESYGAFTMPSLYRVVSGIDCFDPKFNIVSPGVDPDVFFSYRELDRRPDALREEIRQVIFGPPDNERRGQLADPEKPLIFAMSRLDHVKNMAGLAEWYANSPDLQERANLLLVGGSSSVADGGEESEQMHRIRETLGRAELEGKVRWIASHLDRTHAGELYRSVADSSGVFVQPAFFEAFGLTVIEAMSSGLPTFATQYGGPREVIHDGRSGFHIDPNLGDEVSARMIEFFDRCRSDPDYWSTLSEASLKRVAEAYTWELYASKLLSLSRVYGFWKYISQMERQETRRYLEMFFGLVYRPLARGRTPAALST